LQRGGSSPSSPPGWPRFARLVIGLHHGKATTGRARRQELRTLPRLAVGEGGEQVEKIARLFESFRVFDVDVAAARLPAGIGESASEPRLASDASNLSAFLYYLSKDEDRFEDLLRDARAMVPGFKALRFQPVGGAREAVVAAFEEE